ncbi:ATP-dependent DNA helicase Q-like SIM isoform X1 [Solanum tuberosum]|uniref:ATP-dependent DNA helicase Q-like SIM isoform X1 n=1 Tax=Solanum tuberosum TaxID=4113 RepID=UPI0003D27A43|nr:PREDICTED: ATP-dependent DNA helicase Q-like SIM isoform X1 [Solanum tuberosum]XP_006344649.1 PREDICTED: ATP-dependent DNA helicase Q-like SIM isoform X1 [Solanum tuberosum]
MDPDQVVAELVGMGFELSDITNAVEVVGPSIDSAIDYLLDDSRRNTASASTSTACFTSRAGMLGKRGSSSSSCSAGKIRQSSINEFTQSASRPKRSKTMNKLNMSQSEVLQRDTGGQNVHPPLEDSDLHVATENAVSSSYCKDEDIGPDWQKKVKTLLQKHFGFPLLKDFQKDALEAWLSHEDCLVLAATGSGKSLCFQIPALLTGKVVIVISPLISLMHDQCLKLAKHGVSACFLGSGQTDRSVEQKAMAGMYSIIYVCPETILRLIKPLQSLAESRGIALLAVDEVHCVSKWGHDFRPDYRRLSVLRESFRMDTMKFLKFDIPIMALTATATTRVREDILQSLHMSKATKIVLTSFFRPNLRFLVKHSKTSSLASYKKDFHELISIYSRKGKSSSKNKLMPTNLEENSESSDNASNGCMDECNGINDVNVDDVEGDAVSDSDNEVSSPGRYGLDSLKDIQLSVEYLEDECDVVQDVDDLDVSCGEFSGKLPLKGCSGFLLHKTPDLANDPEERAKLQHKPLEDGPTIIYAPTRKETLSISKFLSKFGIKAAAYNAKLPKSHLRQVHKEFHENTLQVIVATIAFGMGIDKLNVRRIIHYGWPQSLEAYYQEAGRAGRDGKVAECVLYANLSRTPTLLPSQRSEEQTKQAYKMLSDCFRYGMNTSCCRAKTLVEYFGEHFLLEKCLVCDICIKGPPERQNLKAEAMIFLQVVSTHCRNFADISYGGYEGRLGERPNIKALVSRIREQYQQFSASDLLWWRGLARLLGVEGFIREGDDMTRVQIKYPEVTERGRQFLSSETEQPFHVYPEADMLLSMTSPKSFSSFAEWGKGWADPEIRRQRLQRKRTWKSPRKRKSRKRQPDSNTVRGRLTAKLSKK